ncbi:MAG: hypothetical protein EGP70_00660 [Butyricicoccus sp.]|nr:hypothetical protein [Butyricicoccus sp.]
MSISLRKLAAKLLAAVTIVGTVTAANAAALEQPVAVLSSSLNASSEVSTVPTEAKAYSRAKADAAVQAKAAAAAKAEADAKAAAQAKADAEAKKKAEEEAKKKAEEEAKKAATLITAPVAARSVSYSAEYLATDAIKANATALGSYKLTFYCPCEICNGALGVGQTASGAAPAEGRTIAVDSSIIPLGSRVYIEGYGTFIAEDTGSAIKNNKIDIFVSTHSRAEELGVQYANVYLLG